MTQLFDYAKYSNASASGVIVTATSDAAPQTALTLTTGDLAAGLYHFAYSFQATHNDKNSPMYFKTGGDISDAAYFANSASDTDELHVNRYYAYPYTHTGGVLNITFLAYKPTGSVTLDFVDLIFTRVG